MRTIGRDKTVDLAKYDRIIVVYQYPLSPIRKEFTEFCERNKDVLSDAHLIIDIPTILLDGSGASEELENIIGYFNRCSIRGGSRALIKNDEFREDKQKRYAERLGFKYESIFDMRTVDSCSVIMTLYDRSYIDDTSERRAIAYMVSGVCIILLCIMELCMGMGEFDTSPVLGKAFILIWVGPVFMFVGYHYRKVARWRGDSTVGQD